MFLIVFFLSGTQNIFAQCGASLSSCKTCHEVKREKPVATQGAWHQQHAFGDFCEFCHGGNTAAKDKATAHQGINTMPLKNAGNTCSSCHPDDYSELAQKYAAILKVDLGNLETTPPASSQKQQASEEKTTESVARTTSASTIAIPSGSEIIDFNELLTAEKKPPVNYGNIILVALILGLFFVFLIMYWYFNRDQIIESIKKLRTSLSSSATTAKSSAETDRAVAILNQNPTLRDLVVKLDELDISTLETLSKILSLNGMSERLVKTLGKLDLKLVSTLNKLSEQDLDLLLALSKKL